MTVSRATLALFARLCVAEAQHGVWNGTSGSGNYEPHTADDAEHLKRLAREADEATWLHMTADTLEDAAKLLKARGMPQMGNIFILGLRGLPPRDRPEHCREKAQRVESGDLSRHAHMYFRERPAKETAAAFRWLATVCERGMGKALLAWEVRAKQVDQEAAVMLTAKHHEDSNGTARRAKLGGKDAWKQRRQGKGRKSQRGRPA